MAFNYGPGCVQHEGCAERYGTAARDVEGGATRGRGPHAGWLQASCVQPWPCVLLAAPARRELLPAGFDTHICTG